MIDLELSSVRVSCFGLVALQTKGSGFGAEGFRCNRPIGSKPGLDFWAYECEKADWAIGERA